MMKWIRKDSLVLLPLSVALIFLLPLFSLPFCFPEYGRAIALFVSVVVLWFTELIPLPVTGLLVPTLATFYGLLEPASAFSAFGNQLIFLFLGSFIIAEAMHKHDWDRRMAYFLLSSRVTRGSHTAIASVLSLLCWTLSMWISNTATCAIIAPLCIGVSSALKDNFKSQEEHNKFNYRVLISCAFASSIGGMATPVGSPPNLLAIEFLKSREIYINFIDWLTLALPISFVMLMLLLVIMHFKFPFKGQSLDHSSGYDEYLKNLKEDLGNIKVAEIQVALCFSVAVCLWTMPALLENLFSDFVKADLSQRIPIGTAAVFAASLLFMLPVKNNNRYSANLSWKDLEKIDWGTIILFAGGLSLGTMLSETGLAAYLGNNLFVHTADSFFLTCLLLIVFSVLMSEFSSNTASAAIVLPVIISSSLSGDSVLAYVLAATFAASFGFMLPVSTPPNAIIYGTGKIPLRKLFSTGIVFDILGSLVILLFSFLYYIYS